MASLPGNGRRAVRAVPVYAAVVACAIAGAIGAAAAPVEVKTTSTQAVMHYTAPDTRACRVEVSESPSYRPLVNDLDPGKFARADQDSREGSAQAGAERWFVAGKRTTERGTDGNLYSRALQAATQHFYRITCGNSVQEGTFTTANVPFGLTYSDAIPADPENPGEVLWPLLDYTDRTKTYVDPQTGVLLRRMTGVRDIHIGGAQIEPKDLTGETVDFSPRAGSAWSGSGFPYSITGSNSDFLVLLAKGGQYWPPYPFDWHSQTYDSDAQGALSWMKVNITASAANTSCNRAEECKIVVCLSVDRVNCHPWSEQKEQAIGAKPRVYTFGDAVYANQGGWLKPGHRWLNPPETADRQGNATCDGTNVVQGGPFNIAWSTGTPVTIGGREYLVQSVQHESQVTLESNCPRGNYPYTSTTLAFLVRAKAASSAVITIQKAQIQWEAAPAAFWPAGAFFDVCSMTATPGAQGRPGYTCLIPDFLGFYWVDAETGEARLIGRNAATPRTSCYQIAAPMDPQRPTRFDCYDRFNDQVLTVEYKGDFADHTPGFDLGADTLKACNDAGHPSNTPCYVNVNLTEGTSFTKLVQQFDSTYDPKKYPCCWRVGTNQAGQYVLYAYRSDHVNSPMWTMVFDPHVSSNREPGNAGCVSAAVGDPTRPGCVIAAMPNWLRGDTRGQPGKGDMVPNPAPGWISVQPMTWEGGAGDGWGPWIMKTSGGFQFTTEPGVPGGLNDCPQNRWVTGKRCTQVTVTSEPFDPDPGPTETGAPGEYYTIEPGDFLYVDHPIGNHDGKHELVRVVAKSGLTLTVARGVTDGVTLCGNPRDMDCGAGGPILKSAVNPVLSAAAISPRAYWNYLKDPHGLLGWVRADQGDTKNHMFSRFGSQAEAGTGYLDARCKSRDGCYSFRLNPSGEIENLFTTGRTGVASQNPGFAGKFGSAAINAVQSHPGPMGLQPASDREKEFLLDGRPYNGTYDANDPKAPRAVAVSGSLWKFPANAVALNRKFLPTKAQVGWRPLLDVSGPRSKLSADEGDAYRYCVVVAKGECRDGSAPGEIYFNAPFLRFHSCVYPGQATQSGDFSDVCIHNQAGVSDNLMQVDMHVSSDDTGLKQRALTKGFGPSKLGAPYWNAMAMPNNKWAAFRTRFVNGFRNEVMLMKMPPVDEDGKDRSTFLPLEVKVASVPARTDNVVVEFGYAENGPADQMFCTTRHEACAAGAGAAGGAIDLNNPFSFTPTEDGALKGMPCASSCTVNVPVISQRVTYYRVRFRDSANQTISVSPVRVDTSPY